ncbi:acetylglutamate kinase [Streptomyces sp. NPDC002499]
MSTHPPGRPRRPALAPPSAGTHPAVAGDALPWPARHRGRTVVIKLGGHAMVDDSLTEAFARDIVSLHRAGLRPVVVHGGGPQIDAELTRRGLERTFRAGLRVTSPAAMDVVRMVLAGQVQRELVGLINRFGPLAVGMTGEDANTLTAVRHVPWVDGEPTDIGRVGHITGVETGVLDCLLADGRIPVVSPLARSAEDGLVHNVNADTVAAALAAALHAEALVMLTDVPGLCSGWPHSAEVIERLTAHELEKLLPELSEGMVPKMTGCLHAVRAGVGAVRVLDGRIPHILREMFAGDGIGTLIVPDPHEAEIPS